MPRENPAIEIRQARALLLALLAECDCPQIETMLRNADMELHWALWNLAEDVPLRPESEYRNG